MTAQSRPKIRHLAIISLDPERLARFYEQTFDMTRLPMDEPGAAVFVTDGYITLALLPNKAEGKPSGLNHFGFLVEDQDAIAERMVVNGARAPRRRPIDRAFAETRGTDPDGNMFDLSVRGYEVSEAATAGVRESVKG